MSTEKEQIKAYVLGLYEGLNDGQKSFIDEKDQKTEGKLEILKNILKFIESVESNDNFEIKWPQPKPVDLQTGQSPIWTTTNMPTITCENKDF